VTTPAAAIKDATQVSELDRRVHRIAAELRCLVCQNQTVADSNSDLANDLRNQVRDMLQKGATDQQVLDFMTQRYGDFVLYKPPFKNTTVALWAGPAVLMVGALASLAFVLRRRARLPDSAFESETELALREGGNTTPVEPKP
jgi:cytochrome c-type biogenesis protein CcmH